MVGPATGNGERWYDNPFPIGCGRYGPPSFKEPPHQDSNPTTVIWWAPITDYRPRVLLASVNVVQWRRFVLHWRLSALSPRMARSSSLSVPTAILTPEKCALALGWSQERALPVVHGHRAHYFAFPALPVHAATWRGTRERIVRMLTSRAIRGFLVRLQHYRDGLGLGATWLSSSEKTGSFSPYGLCMDWDWS